MALQRPTLTEVIDRVLADLSSRMVGVDGAVLRRSVLGALGRTLAGASHELHGRLDFISRQVIIDTAEAEYLERWASVWGIRRKAAEYAIGTVTFTGTNAAFIPAGTVLQRQDGVRFETTAVGTIAAGSATVAVEAQEAGASGNTSAGVAMTLLQPIAGVQSAATVAGDGLQNGSDTEDDDGLRARLLSRIQAPPQGGSSSDYVAWALEVAGVTRAWVYAQEMGAGTVTVRFVRDDDPSIIPGAAEVEAVQAYIDERRPVTAEVFVVAPIGTALDMTIAISPDATEVRESIEAELRDLLTREAEPGGTILVSHLREAISIASGEYDHDLITPAANVVYSTGQIPVLGTITWQSLL
jgi:uncharacterized phage protein gp47/JayE